VQELAHGVRFQSEFDQVDWSVDEVQVVGEGFFFVHRWGQ
jgi:hypothetical protein